MAIDRGMLRVVALAIAASVLVIGLIAALGGFQPAVAGGRAVPAGETVRLQRWTVAVERAAYVDTSPSGLDVDPAVRVWLRITNTTDRTLAGLPERLVTVSVDGVEYAVGREAWGQARSATFDPEVTVGHAYDFAGPGGSVPSAVAVVLRDESERENFVVADHWAVTTPAATVRLPCPDERQRR